ncbi:hypothetical protein ACRALDRAFT_1065531 [Sodiomyces alcalophilus JCM 7366]|uniref:uncharacterized protein n=1 Tax=Sodiomyces alcalophilus JCM 7366 TaxID=591952 RepID=UPI0039B51AF8
MPSRSSSHGKAQMPTGGINPECHTRIAEPQSTYCARYMPMSSVSKTTVADRKNVSPNFAYPSLYDLLMPKTQ